MTRSMVIKWMKWIINLFPNNTEQYEALYCAITDLEANHDVAYLLTEIRNVEKEFDKIQINTKREQEIVWTCQAMINDMLEQYRENKS